MSLVERGARRARRDTFWGYRREDGTVGVRNHLVVVPSVICANTVAQLDELLGAADLQLDDDVRARLDAAGRRYGTVLG